MLSVKRLSHVTLTTTDLEKQIGYYTGVLGLSIAGRERDRVVLATKFGQEAIVLERGEHSFCPRVALQVAPGSDLSELGRTLERLGTSFEQRHDITPNVKQAIAFNDPKGTTVEVFSDTRFCDEDTSDTGIMTRKLGHVAFSTPDVGKVVDFYCQVLGFRVSDWRTSVFAFLRCSPEHHSINLVQGERSTLHHVAFELRDEAEINRSCDLLGKKDIPVIWGPIRHIIGHSISTYHQNSDDVMIELFTDLDLMLHEELGYFEPRRWHQDYPQRPKVWPEDTRPNWWGPPTDWRGPAGMRSQSK